MALLRPSARYFKWFILVGSTLLALAFCEIVLRVILVARAHDLTAAQRLAQTPNGERFVFRDLIRTSENPRLVYELTPDRAGVFQDLPYRSNSHGMRSPEVAREKPPGVWRMAGLGDSTMFGWRVPEEQCYLRVLERALNSVGDKVRYEALNFAVPGYNTALEAEMFESRARDFDPDLVMLQFDLNDLALPNFLQERPRLWTVQRCYVWEAVRGTLASKEARRALADSSAPGLSEAPTRQAQDPVFGVIRLYEFQIEQAPPEYRYMVGWPGVRRALDRLWAATPRPVLHLSNPTFRMGEKTVFGGGTEDEFASYVAQGAARAQPARLFYTDLTSSVDAFCRQHGLDMLRDLSIDFPNDVHPSAARHCLIARAIYMGLIAHRLLPGDSAHYAAADRIAQSLSDDALRLHAERKTRSSSEAGKEKAPSSEGSE